MPPDVAENIGRTWYRGLVAREDGTEEACGVLVWEYKNVGISGLQTEAEIVWAAGERTETMDALFGQYRREIASEYAARSFFEFACEVPGQTVLKSLEAQGFSLRTITGRDLIVTVNDLQRLKLHKKKSPFYVQPLKVLNLRQFSNGIADCMYQGRKGILEDLAWLANKFFEPDVSACILMDEKAKGFLLVHKTGSGVLVVDLLFTMGVNGSRDVLELIRHSVRTALELYPPETKVLLRRHNQTVRALVDRLFPDMKGEEAVAGERMETADE